VSQFLEDNRNYIQWMIYLAAALLFIWWLSPYIASKTPDKLVDTTIRGILLGGIYAIIALGIVVINKASGVFNFAHGGLMMLSAFIFYAFFSSRDMSFVAALLLAGAAVLMVVTTGSWQTLRQPRVAIGAILTTLLLAFLMTVRVNATNAINLGAFQITGTGWLNALTGAIVGTILMGLLIERFTIRPLIGQPVFAAVMVTLAISEILSGFTTLVWGTQPKSLTIFGIPNAFSGGLARISEKIVIDTTALIGFPIQLDQPRLFAFLIAILAFIGFFLFFRFTNIGLAMRATSENQQLAESVGLRVRVILAVTWGIAAVMAGLAGILQVGASDSNSLSSSELPLVALRAFPAVLLGGLESISGALVGGIVLGLTEEWTKTLFNIDVAANLAPYLLLMVILVLRPEGLFGEKRIERI
jgi:branched-chain amino acid transport system permease protein